MLLIIMLHLWGCFKRMNKTPIVKMDEEEISSGNTLKKLKTY